MSDDIIVIMFGVFLVIAAVLGGAGAAHQGAPLLPAIVLGLAGMVVALCGLLIRSIGGDR